MSIENKHTGDGNSVESLIECLYQRAEAALGQRTNPPAEDFAALSPAAAQRVLHDLQVHQIQLEMQNEELRRMQEGSLPTIHLDPRYILPKEPPKD